MCCKVCKRLRRCKAALIKIQSYAGLTYAADTSKNEHRALLQQTEELMTALRNQLLFFDLEWLEVPDAKAQKLMSHKKLAKYAHYLANERKSKPHTLSEAEEKIMNDKNMTGISAWQKLHTEFTASTKFKLEIDGEVKELNQSEVLVLLRHPDRALRQRAWESLFGTLGSNSQVLSFIYDTRFQDHLVTNRLRNYSHPAQPRHLANDIDGETVNTMMSVIEKNYGLAHRYFAMKAKLLKLDKLELFDQYAPLFDVKEQMSYAQARDIILDSMQQFSPQFEQITRRFYDENWIDADPRPGKRGGAFCSGVAPAYNPFILCSYNDDIRDAMTVAHELGHGIHFYLSRKQSLFNFYMSLPVAETASVFAEMLTFDALVQRMDTPVKRLGLLCGKIEDSFATVFRQNVLTRFEELAYAARAKGRLTGEQIGQMWLEANAPYYGEAVNQTKGYEWGWSYIPHFINTPFYCYAYSFGQLLVLALYGMYKREGASFVPKYTALLESGGSLAPREQMKLVGVDIADPNFWQVGFDELERLVSE
ncbi:MAG: M3 family oligoendopeptidase, partial [Anaerolineae bacterium]|nr:M3 family oligoendopeptidase [Anaerolineae bacterium]